MYLHLCKYWNNRRIMEHMEVKKIHQQFGCTVEATLSVIGGRWKPVIIFQLLYNDFLRFGAFKARDRGNH